MRFQSELATNAVALRDVGLDADLGLLGEVSAHIGALQAGIGTLLAATEVENFETDEERALHAKDVLLPAMGTIRAGADALEGLIADDLWSLPTYQEMLFIR